MAWGIEQLSKRSPSVEFDPERWTKLGETLRKRGFAKDVKGAMGDSTSGNEEETEAQLRRMANAYASEDPEKAQQWISAADQIRARIEARKQQVGQFEQAQELKREQITSEKMEKADLEKRQSQALQAIEDATIEWQKDPENPGLQNALRKEINNAKQLKLSPENPIDDYLRNKATEGSFGLREASLKLAEQEAESRQSERAEKRRDTEQAKDIELEKRAEKVMPVYGVYDRLNKNPDDIAARNDAMNRLLRDESGAAIGKDEVLSRLATFLDAKDYEEMVSDLGGLKGWIAGATGNENLLLIQSMKKYLGKMKVDRIKNTLRDRIGSDRVFNYLKSESPSSAEPSVESSSSSSRKIVTDPKSFFEKVRGGK